MDISQFPDVGKSATVNAKRRLRLSETLVRLMVAVISLSSAPIAIFFFEDLLSFAGRTGQKPHFRTSFCDSVFYTFCFGFVFRCRRHFWKQHFHRRASDC
jgi:hypothetical protein